VDVLRAAVSEIEQYERVSLNVQPGIAVRGQAVNDVVHLLAELAENATSFSAADTPVAVSGHLLNSGGGVVGMTGQGGGGGAGGGVAGYHRSGCGDGRRGDGARELAAG